MASFTSRLLVLLQIALLVVSAVLMGSSVVCHGAHDGGSRSTRPYIPWLGWPSHGRPRHHNIPPPPTDDGSLGTPTTPALNTRPRSTCTGWPGRGGHRCEHNSPPPTCDGSPGTPTRPTPTGEAPRP